MLGAQPRPTPCDSHALGCSLGCQSWPNWGPNGWFWPQPERQLQPGFQPGFSLDRSSTIFLQSALGTYPLFGITPKASLLPGSLCLLVAAVIPWVGPFWPMAGAFFLHAGFAREGLHRRWASRPRARTPEEGGVHGCFGCLQMLLLEDLHGEVGNVSSGSGASRSG